jgi:hypothetical protein
MTISQNKVPEKSFETGLKLVPTNIAAKMLMRTTGTMRNWSSNGNGLIRPIRVGRRLGWPLSEIEALLAGQSESEVAK